MAKRLTVRCLYKKIQVYKIFLIPMFIGFTNGFIFACLKLHRNYYMEQNNDLNARIHNTSLSLENANDMKYILLWPPVSNPMHLLKSGQISFIENRCPHTNCFVTEYKKFLSKITAFDAVLFSGCELSWGSIKMPQVRSLKQKYVFANVEPSAIYPISDPAYDNYFNWTWTFRLNSDIIWKYMLVYDLNGTVVGPAEEIKWPMQMKTVNKSLKAILKTKAKVAAWVVSHCRTEGKREKFVEKFNQITTKYGWRADIYGACGNKTCDGENCFNMIKNEYYFYFAFENSIEQDYVTEKLLIALNNFAIPVVYGGADYSRFLPPESYLNARMLGPEKLAETMNAIVKNRSRIYDFFKWRNHFVYKEALSSKEICNICTALNDKRMIKYSVVKNFRSWWTGFSRLKIYDLLFKNFLINKNLTKVVEKTNYTISRDNNRLLLESLKKQFIKSYY